MNIQYKNFYDSNRSSTYKHDYNKIVDKEHWAYEGLRNFIDKYNLKDARCLEIGSSGGMFQNMVVDYTGIDVAESLKKFYHKPYFVIEDETYPFTDSEFDVIWTIAVFEHIPDVDMALNELKRVLKNDGIVYFNPAWNVRSWVSSGLAVRPYSDLNSLDKIRKFIIPLRESLVYRSMSIFPLRIVGLFSFFFSEVPQKLYYRKLNANYEKYWVNDADACNSIDPFHAILWFLKNDFNCLSYKNLFTSFFVRTGPIVFQKK